MEPMENMCVYRAPFYINILWRYRSIVVSQYRGITVLRYHGTAVVPANQTHIYIEFHNIDHSIYMGLVFGYYCGTAILWRYRGTAVPQWYPKTRPIYI